MSTVAKIGVVSCLLAMTLGAVTKDLYTLILNGFLFMGILVSSKGGDGNG